MAQVNASYSSQPGLGIHDTANAYSTSLLLPSQLLDPTGSRSSCACPMGQSSCWGKAHSYQQWASMEESKRYMWTCTWASSTRTVKGKYIKILSGLEGTLISTFLHFSLCINPKKQFISIMEELKNLLNKIMSYKIVSFELKFKDSREWKDVRPDFMSAAEASIPVIPQSIHASCWSHL